MPTVVTSQLIVDAIKLHQLFAAPCEPATVIGDLHARIRWGEVAHGYRILNRYAGGSAALQTKLAGATDADKAAAASAMSIDVNNLILLLNALIAALPAIVALFSKT